jgi:hypothetical protein
MNRSFPSMRGSSTCPWYKVRAKMSDKNVEQRLNSKFCVKNGKGATKIMAYGNYAMKKFSVFE